MAALSSHGSGGSRLVNPGGLLSRSVSTGGGLGGLSRSEAFLINVDPRLDDDDDLLSSSSEESLPIFDEDDEDLTQEIETDV